MVDSSVGSIAFTIREAGGGCVLPRPLLLRPVLGGLVRRSAQSWRLASSVSFARAGPRLLSPIPAGPHLGEPLTVGSLPTSGDRETPVSLPPADPPWDRSRKPGGGSHSCGARTGRPLVVATGVLGLWGVSPGAEAFGKPCGGSKPPLWGVECAECGDTGKTG
jgi:hypothetical protein